jgi:signal transduction histidine kinase/phage shock protein PspC (stress-responsive transcriptional regulator)
MDLSAITFNRRDDGRVVAGVASGFARRHGVDVLVLRCALVVLTFAAGLGLLLYAVGAAISRPEVALTDEAADSPDMRRNVSVGLVTVGALLVVRSTGLWLGDPLMVPLVVLAVGVAVLGVERRDDETSQLAGLLAGRHARARVALGAVLLVLGLVSVGTADRLSGTVRVGVFAAAISIVGVALLLGPWITGLAQAAADDRRRRIRSEERAAMAAHLHDSVLQTLALIQRNADDPRRVAALARQQEHELRGWLFGADEASAGTFAAAVTGMAREVEQRYDVRVELVTVGDADLDDALLAVVAAAREACANAATHSGESTLSMYAEVSADIAEVFVRDRGVGFDPSSVATDRQGVSQSIVGRIERLGGWVRLVTATGEGTEVQMHVPRSSMNANLNEETMQS